MSNEFASKNALPNNNYMNSGNSNQVFSIPNYNIDAFKNFESYKNYGSGNTANNQN